MTSSGIASSGKRRTQAERIEATENAMFRAAIKLIARDGPTKMTLARIGKEAGVSPGLVNHRFGTKEKLLEATATKAFEGWSALVRGSSKTATGLPALDSLSKRYLKNIKAGNDLVLAQGRLMIESCSTYPHLQSLFIEGNRQVRSFIVDLLRPAQEAGEIKAGIDLESFAITFIAMLRGTGTQYLVDNDIDIDQAHNMLMMVCSETLSNN